MGRRVWYRPKGTQHSSHWQEATLVRIGQFSAVGFASIRIENDPSRKGRRRVWLVVPLAHLAERQ